MYCCFRSLSLSKLLFKLSIPLLILSIQSTAVIAEELFAQDASFVSQVEEAYRHAAEAAVVTSQTAVAESNKEVNLPGGFWLIGLLLVLFGNVLRLFHRWQS